MMISLKQCWWHYLFLFFIAFLCAPKLALIYIFYSQASPKVDYQSEKSQQDDSRAIEDQIERQDILQEGEEGEEEDEGEETVIDVTIPYFKVSLGTEVYFVKMPNFMSVETKPFDSALYEDEIEDDEVLDEEGNARLKLKVIVML